MSTAKGQPFLPSRGSMAAAAAVRAALIFVAWAGLVPFLLMLMATVVETWRYKDYGLETQSFWARIATAWTSPDKMVPADLEYTDHFGGGYYTSYIVFWWVPALTSIIAVALLPAVPYASRVGAQKGFSTLIHKVKALSSYPLPPRQLWMFLLGGLTVLEAFLLAVWIILHAVMFWDWYEDYIKGYKYVDEIIGMTFSSTSLQKVKFERAALTFGWLCFLDVAILFWPIARNSFLHQLLGVPYPVLIKFHRWVGHTTMWSTTLHGVCYYIYWGIDKEYSGWAEFSDWGQHSYINNLAGSIAWFFGMALWITSLNYVRRRWYQMYHYVHIIGFLGYTLFAMTHYGGMFVAFVPGLFLYIADIAIRLCQSGNVTTITEWRIVGKGNNRGIVFTLPVDKAVVQKPLQDYWLNFPGVSRWHWHPLTCLYPREGSEQANAVTFCMKAKGKWSTAVLESIIKHQNVPVRVSGPVGGESVLSENYDQLLLLAGGVGSIPLLSVVEDMVARRQKGGIDAACVPRGVRLVWTSREREEFTLISESIMEAASGANSWLQVDLIFSGSTVVPVNQPLTGTPDQLKAHKLEAEGTAVKKLVQAHPAGKSFIKEHNGVVSLSSDPQPVGGCPLKFSGISPLFWDRIRPIQPDVLNKWHYTACVAMAFFGGFWGNVLGNSFTNNFYSVYPSESRYWLSGFVQFFTVVVCSLGLPITLVMFPAHFWRYIRSRGQTQKLGEATVMAQGAMKSASLLMDERVGFQETGMWLPIKIGRLNLAATLEEAATALKGSRVGVYVAGPETMVQQASLQAWALNDKRKGAYLNVHRATYEL